MLLLCKAVARFMTYSFSFLPTFRQRKITLESTYTSTFRVIFLFIILSLNQIHRTILYKMYSQQKWAKTLLVHLPWV